MSEDQRRLNGRGRAGLPVAGGRCRRRPRRRRVSGIVLAALSVVVFLGGWYLMRQIALSDRQRFLLPAPHDVWSKGIVDSEVRGEILEATLVTAKEAAVGLLLAMILGVALGAAMSQAKWIERSFFPWAIVLQTVPILAIVPLLDLWAKNDILFVEEGFRSRIIVCVIIALFPIISNTFFGLLSADATHHDLFTANCAESVDEVPQAGVPGRAAGDVHGVPHLRRAGGGRGDHR